MSIASALGWKPSNSKRGKSSSSAGTIGSYGPNATVVDSAEKLEVALAQFAMLGGAGHIQRRTKKK